MHPSCVRAALLLRGPLRSGGGAAPSAATVGRERQAAAGQADSGFRLFARTLGRHHRSTGSTAV